MAPLAVLGLCAAGGKLVHLGKEWYELHRDLSRRRLAGMEPATETPPGK